ncbi:MAG: cell division protein FtsH, partial [Clostridia bacterium]|nr:cell division protein FtsH [Clostridia bacterium]
PGRFDRQVTVNYPDVRGREEILKVHAEGKPLAPDADLALIAKRTPFSTGADLENIMNEAAILCARGKGQQITMHHLQEAVERVEMGPEKRSHTVHPKDKKIVAYHEAGHALVGAKMPLCPTVQLVTIIPRGPTGGHTLLLPEEERDFESSKQLHDNLAMALGGYAAERLVFGDMTTGATSDLRRATEISRRMITHCGMSDELGPIYLGGEQEVFLGRDFTQQSRSFSENMAAKIDQEVHNYLRNAYERAEKALRDNIEKLHAVADALMEKETLYRAEFEAILAQA